MVPTTGRRAKIVCTLGPASSDETTVRALAEAGMDVARMNLSHGSHAEHAERIALTRKVAKDIGLPLAVLLDLSGPKIRTGTLVDGPVALTAGGRFILTAGETPGDAKRVSMNYPGLVAEVDPGDPILMADGSLELRVADVVDDDIVCEVVVGGELGEHKGINVPSKSLTLPSLTDKDARDLRFGLAQGVDWVALSFVRTRQDVVAAKRMIADAGHATPLIAKIEKRAALDNLEGILDVADGVMVARGDLGVEIPMHEIPWAQKEIIRAANDRGLPVVTATQMLESMIENPRPTRAELTDIANAILDGTDAVMLSGETAVGRHPVRAVRIMCEVATAPGALTSDGPRNASRDPMKNIKNAISRSACGLAEHVDADYIICCTRSGSVARAVARFRPSVPILGISSNEAVLRQLQLSRGVFPLRIDEPTDTDDLILKGEDAARDAGLPWRSGVAVIVASAPLNTETTTNMIRVEAVQDPSP